jgi:hypothetical protein
MIRRVILLWLLVAFTTGRSFASTAGKAQRAILTTQNFGMRRPPQNPLT